uniref:Cytochrome P450 26A1 n=1 Tax=Callorhinchus milii TaxID=7868 RepID=A0A4W3JYP3_CALMI
MFNMVLFTLFATFLCTCVLPLLLFLAAVKLWEVYCISGRDPSCKSPLPPGSMGLPFLGETLQYKFLKMKVQKYGYIYKTHLFGSPTVRIMGAENVKQILLGEHKLVSVQWPASVRTILGAACLSSLHDSEHKHRKRVSAPFSVTKHVLPGPLNDQSFLKKLMACWPGETPSFSIGLKARNVIHAKIEENIRKKMAKRDTSDQFKDNYGKFKHTPPPPLRPPPHKYYTGMKSIPHGLRFRCDLRLQSICDTHDIAEIFSKKDEFNPDRFMEGCLEKDSSRFGYIPFGGGSRSCVGKEFAKVLLKIFTVELVRTCDWELLNGPPTMKTSPTVYPVDNLPTKFTEFYDTV